jgi:hypothetical protein
VIARQSGEDVMDLMRVRLELARTPDHPEGSRDHGYEFVAPMTKDGHIDAQGWKEAKERCRVIRFWGSGEPETGMLRHVGRGWRFDYDTKQDTDDEPFFKLDRHALTEGAYVSITEHDGVQRPFKVVSVIPVSA